MLLLFFYFLNFAYAMKARRLNTVFNKTHTHTQPLKKLFKSFCFYSEKKRKTKNNHNKTQSLINTDNFSQTFPHKYESYLFNGGFLKWLRSEGHTKSVHLKLN